MSAVVLATMAATTAQQFHKNNLDRFSADSNANIPRSDSDDLITTHIPTKEDSAAAAASAGPQQPNNQQSNLVACPQCRIEPNTLFEYLENPMGEYSVQEIALARIHLLVDHPDSSPIAALIQIGVILLIFMSTIQLVLSSVDGLSDWKGWDYIELVVSVLFTIELIFRFISARSKKDFVKNPMNIVDLMAILPFYLNLALADNEDKFAQVRILRVIRLITVFRLFKLGRYIGILSVFKKTLQNSAEPLFLLGLFVVVLSILFGSVIYAIESGEYDAKRQIYVRSDGNESPYTNILVGIYWAITTLSTIGNGDISPIENWGRFTANVAMILGILVFALPLAVIGSNFQHSFEEYKLSKLKKGSKGNVKNMDLKDRMANVVNCQKKMAAEMKKMIAALHQQRLQVLSMNDPKFSKRKQMIIDNAFKSVSSHCDSHLETLRSSIIGVLDNVEKVSELFQMCQEDWTQTKAGTLNKMLLKAKLSSSKNILKSDNARESELDSIVEVPKKSVSEGNVLAEESLPKWTQRISPKDFK